MLRPKTIGLVNQRRTLRALYAQTQAYPYAATLYVDPSLSVTDANGVPTGNTSQTGLALSDGTTGVGLWPGAVMTLATLGAASPTGEVVQLSTGSNGVLRPFGLSANFVGGNMDELNGNLGIGVWRGRGGVFEILAPLFSTTISGTDDLGAGAVNTKAGVLIDIDGDDSTAVDLRVARLISILSEGAILVELQVGG